MKKKYYFCGYRSRQLNIMAYFFFLSIGILGKFCGVLELFALIQIVVKKSFVKQWQTIFLGS